MRSRRAVLAKMMAVVLAGLIVSSCRPSSGTLASDGSRRTLRVGIGGASATGNEGLRNVAQLQSVENLARLTDDGRLQPWLAHDWNVSADGRSVSVNLMSGVKFHDGSP